MKTVGNRLMENAKGVVVTLHHPRMPPSDEDFARTVELLTEQFKRFGRAYQIVFTDGPAPNAKQRKFAAETAKSLGATTVYKSAVVSSSPIARGVMTALVWLGFRGLKPFAPDDIKGALAFVDLDTSHLPELAATVKECLAECETPALKAAALVPGL